MPMERQLRIWHLEVCSQSADEDTWLSKGAAKLLRHEKHCHVEDGVCSWANHKIIITAGMPDIKDVSPYTWLDKHNEIPRTKIGTKCVGTLTSLEGIRTLFGKSLSKATRGPMAHQCNPGQSRAPRSSNSAECLVAENPRKRLCDRAPPYRACETNETAACPRRHRRQQRTTRSLLHTCPTFGEET